MCRAQNIYMYAHAYHSNSNSHSQVIIHVYYYTVHNFCQGPLLPYLKSRCAVLETARMPGGLQGRRSCSGATVFKRLCTGQSPLFQHLLSGGCKEPTIKVVQDLLAKHWNSTRPLTLPADPPNLHDMLMKFCADEGSWGSQGPILKYLDWPANDW
jgi:hypothetical protein